MISCDGLGITGMFHFGHMFYEVTKGKKSKLLGEMNWRVISGQTSVLKGT